MTKCLFLMEYVKLFGCHFPHENSKSAVEKLSMHESRLSVSRTVTQPLDFNSLISNQSVFMAFKFILDSE